MLCFDVQQHNRKLASTKVEAGSSNSAASKFILHYINHAAVCGWIPDKCSQFIRSSTICTAAEDPLTRLEHSQYVVKLNVRNVSVLAAPWELHVQNVPSFHCCVDASRRRRLISCITHGVSACRVCKLVFCTQPPSIWNCYEVAKGRLA